MYFGFDKITISYDKTAILRDVTLELFPGEILTLVGKNGCGKSSLLKTIVRAVTPRSGTPILNGKPLSAYPAKELAKKIAYLAQFHDAPPDLTVRALVECGRYPHRSLMGGLSASDAAQVDRAITLTGLAELENRPLSTLSGGECQRAWIAMTVAQEPEILVLDEPVTYLDIGHQTEVLALIRRLSRELGITVLMVLHDLNAAARVSDRLCALKDGGIFYCGAPSGLFTPEHLYALYGIEAEILHDSAGNPYFIPITGETPK